MRQVALHSPYRKQIDFSNSPEVVSTDFVGSRAACVFDAQATIVNGDTLFCTFGTTTNTATAARFIGFWRRWQG